MIGSWVVFPLAAIAVCLGHGLLVDRAAGRVVRPVLLVPVGAALLVCVTQLTTIASWSAPATVPVVVVVTLVGFVIGRGRLRELAEARWAALAALGAFVLTGLPVIATGEPTFAGYTVLADTVVHLTGAVQLLETARDFSGLGTSDYRSLLQEYYVDAAYPSGGATVLGSLARIVGVDVAWVFQPYLSVLIGVLALAISGLVQPVVGSARRAALIGLIGAQPALLTGFVMQGSMKEVATVALLATAAAMVGTAAAEPKRYRCAIPLGVAVAACIGVIGPSAVAWLVPLLAGWAALLAADGSSRRIGAATVAVAGACTVVLALPTVLLLGTSAATASSVATAPGELGNLLVPLEVRQAVGVWLAGDFRAHPVGFAAVVTAALQVLVVALAVAGMVWSWRRRSWDVALYAAASVAGSLLVLLLGTAWADAKALAIASPAILVLALVGIATVVADRSRVAAVVAGALVGGGVLLSTAMIYWSASVAPYDRLHALAELNARADIETPILAPTQDEFVTYFLRDLRPHLAPVAWVPGGGIPPAASGVVDLDSLPVTDLAPFPTVIMRSGPIGSRPSSAYTANGGSGSFTVWRSTPASKQAVFGHFPLGTSIREPASVPSCSDVRSIARQARSAGGDIVAAVRPDTVVVNPALARRPPSWSSDRIDPELTLPVGEGTAESTVTTRAGRFDVWLEGSVGRRTKVLIDGREVGSARNLLAVRRTAVRLGGVELDAGRHTVRVTRAGRDLLPGNGGLSRPLGAVFLVPGGDTELLTVAPRDWRELCGRPLDWIEVVV